MDENRMKEIEEKLHQMIVFANKSKDKNQRAKSKSNGAKVIRRRKGSPDIKVV